MGHEDPLQGGDMGKVNVTEMNERIEAKLNDLKEGRPATKRARKVVSKSEVRVEELRAELKEVREVLSHHRSAISEVRAQLHVAELEEEVGRLRIAVGGRPEELAEADSEGSVEQIARLGAGLDSLSGLIEDDIATRDRLLDRLDRLRDAHAEAEVALTEAIKERDEDRQALERMRRRRRKIMERSDRPSRHFAYAEFDCRNGQELPKAAEAAVKDWCERIGEPLRERFGAVHVNSAYRPASYNSAIGGEPNSIHIYDFPGRNCHAVAVDIACERGTPTEWYEFTTGKADGRGLYGSFHHADTRGRIGWSAATWSG